MADYISREDAKAFIHDRAIEMALNNVGFKADASDILEHISQRSKDWIDEVPAADVRPVVHGEWRNAHPSSPLLDGGGPPYCSVCGKEAPLRSVEVNQWKLERGSLSGPEVVYKTKCFLSNFCPNCGADCRGGNDGK